MRSYSSNLDYQPWNRMKWNQSPLPCTQPNLGNGVQIMLGPRIWVQVSSKSFSEFHLCNSKVFPATFFWRWNTGKMNSVYQMFKLAEFEGRWWSRMWRSHLTWLVFLNDDGMCRGHGGPWTWVVCIVPWVCHFCIASLKLAASLKSLSITSSPNH